MHLGYLVDGNTVFQAFTSAQWGEVGFPVRTDIWVDHASRLLGPNGCADVAPRRFEFVLVDDASDF